MPKAVRFFWDASVMPYLYAIRGKGKTHSASFPSNPVRGNQRERTKGQSRVKIFQHHNQFIQISARAALE
jgi:hypothetical protein